MNLSKDTISADHAEDFRDFRRCVKLSHIYYTYATFSDADEGFYIVDQSPSSFKCYLDIFLENDFVK
jgi:hypothetical protein